MIVTLEGWSKPREAHFFNQANQTIVHFETRTDRCSSECEQCRERLEKVERTLMSKHIGFTKDRNSAVEFPVTPDFSKGSREALKQALEKSLDLKVLEIN